MTSPDEDVEVIGRTKSVDLELDLLLPVRQFTVEWWRDLERTIPIDYTAVQIACAREGVVLFDESTAGVTLTPVDNVCNVEIAQSVVQAIGATDDWDLNWFFQGTNASGVVMLVRGRARVV